MYFINRPIPVKVMLARHKIFCMKKLIIIALACFAGTSLMAQKENEKNESKKTERMEHKMSMKKDCVMMKEGKMMVMKDGKTMAMTSDMTMSNGAIVMADGSVKMKDGTTKMIKNGDCMYMDGKMKMGHTTKHKRMKHHTKTK